MEELGEVRLSQLVKALSKQPDYLMVVGYTKREKIGRSSKDATFKIPFAFDEGEEIAKEILADCEDID
uniref:Uncharacterized protein n=1 Tax=viral metagenome TaxID=1070528 RepID=A0A6M3L4R8_9ZZZZ